MFENREEAGQKLALKLRKTIKDGDFIVVALLRGGIVLGKKVSDYFKIPLIALAVKKIGAPLNPELAIGAVTFDKTLYLDRDIIKRLDVDEDYIKSALEIKWNEAKIMQKKFKSRISLKNKRVLIVDDGVATGTTTICASKFCRKNQAQEIILAIPVISKDVLRSIRIYFDRIISLQIVDSLSSVGEFYEEFPQIEDEEVGKFFH